MNHRPSDLFFSKLLGISGASVGFCEGDAIHLSFDDLGRLFARAERFDFRLNAGRIARCCSLGVRRPLFGENGRNRPISDGSSPA